MRASTHLTDSDNAGLETGRTWEPDEEPRGRDARYFVPFGVMRNSFVGISIVDATFLRP